MKVLQINSFFSVGGPPRIVNGIYDTLKEEGYECKIAAAREKKYVLEDSIQIGTDIDVKINALKTRVLDNESFSAKKATRKFIKKIEKYNPDIIHLHNLHGYYINIEILFDYLKSADKPVVWTLHDCWAVTGHCAHFSVVKCEKWKMGCYDCPQKKEYPSSIGLDQSKKNYFRKKTAFHGVNNMTIVTPSNWLAEFIPNSILKEYPTKVIYNGIDLDTFFYIESDILKKNGLADKKIILGVAQNWAEKKGFEDFIELSKKLDASYKVVLIGLTEEQKNELPDTMFGLTRTKSVQELIKWYSAATVFVNLTYQDTFPTVNIEALACGTPVITYKTGGSPEAVDKNCGWIVEQGNVAEVARIIQNIKSKSQYFDTCIQRVKQFDRKERYTEYMELYKTMNEMINARGGVILYKYYSVKTLCARKKVA